MRKIFSAFGAAALAASVAASGAFPAAAAPVFVPKTQTLERSDIVQVKEPWKKRGRHYRGKRNRGFYKYDDYGWYNGHRGYRHKRYKDDRYYNGWWFPGGAFIAGAIIGGAIANSNNNYYYGGGGSAHVRWCYDRYRSYREWDNTFQPYNGPRRLCYSPYS